MFRKPKTSVSDPYLGIESGFNQVSGSGSGIRIHIRIQERRNDAKNRKREEISSFEGLDVRRTSFMEA
jgi:hypothetical protein